MAMDFSGQKSRVIENPSEVLSVAVEEGLSWRVSHSPELSLGLNLPEEQLTETFLNAELSGKRLTRLATAGFKD